METVEQDSASAQGENAQSDQPSANTDDSVTSEHGERSDTSVEASKTEKTEQPNASKKKSLPDDGKGGKERGWVQARLSSYASRVRASEEALREVRAELERYKAGGGGEKRIDPSRAPSPDDYSRHEDYVDALVDWKIGQRDKQRIAQTEAQTANFASEQRRMEFGQHAQKFAMGYEDPQAVLDLLYSDESIGTPLMAEAIMDLGEHGPLVGLHLAQNPMEALRIAQLSQTAPRRAVMEIGRLADKLIAHVEQPSPSQNAQPPANRPTPVPTIRGGVGSGGMAAPTDSDSTMDWVTKEAARMRGKYGNNVRMYIPRRVG